VLVNLAQPGDRVGRQIPDHVTHLPPGVLVPVGDRQPLPADQPDPDEVDRQVLLDRGDGLPDDRLAVQVLADADRRLMDLGQQAGPVALGLLDAIALVGEEVEGLRQVPDVGRSAGDRARVHVAERPAAHRPGGRVQRPAHPAQAYRHGEHGDHEADRQDRHGPAQADAQNLLALERQRVAVGHQEAPQPVVLGQEGVGDRIGAGVAAGRGNAAYGGRHRLVVGGKSGPRAARLRGRLADKVAGLSGEGQLAYPGLRRLEPGPLGQVGPQEPGLAGRLVAVRRALRADEVGLQGEVGGRQDLNFLVQVGDGIALVAGTGQHERDHAGHQHRLRGEPGPRVKDDGTRLPHRTPRPASRK
jgi:hypothetical protein